MSRPSVASRWNLDLIETNYQRWRDDPQSVDESWRSFFEGYELALDGAGTTDPGGAPADGRSAQAQAQAGVTQLVDAYREIGHYLADLDPLQLTPPRTSHEMLELSAFGLTEADLDRTFFNPLGTPAHATLRSILEQLRATYCRTIGVEYMHIQNRRIRTWLQERMEPNANRPSFDTQRKRRALLMLNRAALFETFLHSHYIGQKRFSLEGGEMLIPLLDTLIERAGNAWKVKEIVIGMPHRGRLNVLANILNKPYGYIFHEFEGNRPKTVAGDGDVKYHLGFSYDHQTAEGQSVHLSLTPNPSHLEAVDPVVEGRVRAKQRRFKDTERKFGIPLLIHGDAAFAGQGLVMETLNLSQLNGYRTGGTIHVVVNNQIGFTTAPADSRSTRYCTDLAKMIEVPIFHVNGEDTEACAYVAELAMDFRQTFAQDVVIDMVCYRKHGHNEGDEPAFTQPLEYEKIRERPNVVDLYTESLIVAGELTTAEAETIEETFKDKLQAVYDEVHNRKSEPVAQAGYQGPWKGLDHPYSFEPTPTGVPAETLRRISDSLAKIPDGFQRNPKLDRILATRAKAFETDSGIDWGFAEALSFGSLLLEGTPVRLSGQDSRRGTFSHRHAVLVDYRTAERFTPLNHLSPDQANFCVYDSSLSEAGVLGFDYGYSLDEPNMLILWEAQFGDFSNGAQVIIDQFIASAESKWGRSSGIVMLLPHGYEGQGPEHSSARLERYLQLCAEDNIQVVYPTTPAQYFHLLRRQMRRNFRKPLIVMTPKSLLRLREAVSPVADLVNGSFQDVIDDPVDARGVRRVIFSSGKVYYDLLKKRAEAGKEQEIALVRLEQFYPWPEAQLSRIVDRYRPQNVEWVWVQEESQNNGGWSFVAPRLRELLHEDVLYVGRGASASPATGLHSMHEREQHELVEAAIDLPVPHLV